MPTQNRELHPAVALPRRITYQLTIIGGFTDAFHFYPVIIHDNTATIYPHNNLLEYNKTYYVQIDPGVLTLGDSSFSGITGKTGWTFTTKNIRLQIILNGSWSAATAQAISAPCRERSILFPIKIPNRVTIFIKNGTYEEIVYFRNKTNITFLGEDRDKVDCVLRQ